MYFDSDLPPSYFEGDSERAREVAAGPHRKSLVITAADIEGRIKSEYPDLYAEVCKLAKTVEPPPPESLRATDDPDVYSIRVGQALRVVR